LAAAAGGERQRAVSTTTMRRTWAIDTLEEAAAAKPVDQDLETIEGLENEERYRDGFTAAMDGGRIDAVVLPTFAQLPAINGDRPACLPILAITSAFA
jgi:hypothetical protein